MSFSFIIVHVQKVNRVNHTQFIRNRVLDRILLIHFVLYMKEISCNFAIFRIYIFLFSRLNFFYFGRFRLLREKLEEKELCGGTYSVDCGVELAF